MLLLSTMAACQKSGYVNCVTVADKSGFIGEWLKTQQPLTRSVVKLEDCVALDAKEDGADGAKIGRVRWAECFAAPDCDEAGDF